MREFSAGSCHITGDRLSGDELESQVHAFRGQHAMMQAFNLAHVMIVILNAHRQVVFANRTFLRQFGLEEDSGVIGKRPGEILNCTNANISSLGCGTSKACKTCNVVNTIVKAIFSKETIMDEASILRSLDDGYGALNVNLAVEPYRAGEEEFFIVTLTDISDTVKKREFERIFFHDLINTAGALKGLVNLVKEDLPAEPREELIFVEETLQELVDVIKSQKQLVEAENSELAIELSPIRSLEIISLSAALMERHDVCRKKQIIIDPASEEITFSSDPVLLKRIIINMLKNALEETPIGGAVHIGCKKAGADGTRIEFWVRNSKYMDRDIQFQVFRRSFSTKGRGRGLGTYSMKLLGEKYLGGQVGFDSGEVEGTTFYVRLPLGLN